MSVRKRSAPLIPESLVDLYRRMAQAWRSPVPPEVLAIAMLSRLVELHQCLATTIETAVARSDPGGREHLRELAREQTRLAHAVGELVTELGGSPPLASENLSALPRDRRAMSDARDQTELMGLVHEDLDYVGAAYLELAASSAVPFAIRQRLEALAL